MAKVITILNGVGTDTVPNGNYAVTASVNGYDNSTINPDSILVQEGTNEYSFTIAATGTLTLHVTEDGSSTGTPVVGAKFYRTDSEGTTYGSEVVTDSNGDAVLANVPFGDPSLPIYYKQTESDGSHEFSDSVSSITMTTETETVEIINSLAATRTITLTDANYANLPVDGSLTLS